MDTASSVLLFTLIYPATNMNHYLFFHSAGLEQDGEDEGLSVAQEAQHISIHPEQDLHHETLSLTPKLNNDQDGEHSIMTTEPVEDPAHIHSQPVCNGHLPEHSQASILKPRPPSLKMKSSLNAVDPNEVDDEPPQLPKGSYNFDLDQCNANFNPFTSSSSKMQNSPTLPKGTYNFDPDNFDNSLDPFKASKASGGDLVKTEPDKLTVSSGVPKPQLPDPESSFQPDSVGENVGSSRIPSQKQGKRPGAKVTPKKQRAKPAQVQSEASEQSSKSECDSGAPLNVDDIPIPKKSYNFDPSQWDDPSFNPFGGIGKLGNSPTLPKGGYTFDPDNFDESMDPCKPAKAFGVGDESVKTEAERNPECPLVDDRKARQSPMKNKDRIIT